jgi:hypothetical protein
MREMLDENRYAFGLAVVCLLVAVLVPLVY